MALLQAYALGLATVGATITSTARLTSTNWQPTACGGGSLQFPLAAGIISGLALGVTLTPPLSANATILGISLAVVKWCTRESPATVDVAVQFGDSREMISRNARRSDPWPKTPTQIRYGNATDNWQVTDPARFAQAMLRLESVSAVADTCTVQLECRALNVTWSLPATTTRMTTTTPSTTASPTAPVPFTAPGMTTASVPPAVSNQPTATSAATTTPVPSMTTTAAVMAAPVWSTAAKTVPVETVPTIPAMTTTIAPIEPWSTDYSQPPINISLIAGLAVIAALLVIGAIASALAWRMRKNLTPNSRQAAAVQTVYGSIPNARQPAAAALSTIQYEQWPAAEVTHYYGLESGSDSRTSYASIELSPASTASPANNSRPAHYLHFWQNRQSAN